MSRQGPRTAVHRHAARPVLQAKPADRPLPARTQAEPRLGGGAGHSFAAVPVHAPGAGPERLPVQLRAGIEHLSGFAMGDVRVHRNSPKPPAVGAHAFTRGDDIHLGAGQERHLPHEAWHAVQQKQGRVQATGRIGGAPMSDDAGLETEADRMGARALSVPTAPGVPAASPSPVPEGGEVVQAKLISNGTDLPDSPAVSDVSRRFIRASGSYLLRGDVSPSAPTIHVLDMSKKYLLGEQHGSGAWERETKPWPQVTKITEAYKKLPREAEDEQGVLASKFDPQRMPDGQPLESAHPFLFASLMQAQAALFSLTEAMRASPDEPNRWSTFVSAAKEHLGEVRILVKDYYGPYQEAFDKTLPGSLKDRTKVTPRLSIINRAARRLVRSLAPGGGIDTISKALADIDRERSAPRAVRPGFAAKQAERIDAQAGVFTDVAKDIAQVFPGATPDQEKALQDILATRDPFKRPDISTATTPFREASMAETIRGARAPVLVQLGLAHADRVAGMVGADAISIVDPETLSDVTRQPQPATLPSGGDAEAARSPKAGGVARRMPEPTVAPPPPRGDAEVTGRGR